MIPERAFINVVRQLSRTLLSLWVMIIAAMVMTSSLSYSQGTTSTADLTYRNYYGGDILVFSPGFIGASPLSQSEEAIEMRLLRDSGFNILAKLYPDFVEEGYLAHASWGYETLTEEFLLELSTHPNTSATKPIYIMPARSQGMDINIKVFPWHDNQHELEGRPPADGSGVLEIVVNAYRAPKVQVGETLAINVPAYRLDQSKIPYIDASVLGQTHDALVVGLISRPTRKLLPLGADIPEQAFVHAPEVYVTDAAYATLWSYASGDAVYPVLAAGIDVLDLSIINTTVTELQRAYPSLSFMATHDIARHVERYTLLDWFYAVAPHMWLTLEGAAVQSFAPREFGLLSVLLLYLNAGLLLATQMMSRIAERRKEIGVLKAIGARQREIVGMIFLESLFLATIGAFIGFIAIRSLAIHQAATNAVPWGIILGQTIKELFMVMGVTAFVALLFAVIPAAKVASLTVMEVFRSD